MPVTAAAVQCDHWLYASAAVQTAEANRQWSWQHVSDNVSNDVRLCHSVCMRHVAQGLQCIQRCCSDVAAVIAAVVAAAAVIVVARLSREVLVCTQAAQ
jgi:hypothetical protein